MDWLPIIIIGWALSSVAAFILFERDITQTFGRFTRADALFNGVLSLTGPIWLFWALIITAASASHRSGFWNKPFRRRR